MISTMVSFSVILGSKANHWQRKKVKAMIETRARTAMLKTRHTLAWLFFAACGIAASVALAVGWGLS